MKNKCPKCGAKISPGYDLCLSCSYKFLRESRQIPTISDKKVEKPFRICPHCRQKLPLGAKFCVTCGQKVEDLKPIPPISELLQGEKTSKPIPSVSELKTGDTQTASSISEKKVKKSFTTCPHCRQKLHLRAKFCFNCGQKVEVLKPIPPISDIKETNGQINLNWLKHQYYDLGRTMQDIADEQGVSMIRIRKLLYRSGIISEKKEVKLMTDVPPLKTEEVQPTPPISGIKEEMPKITPVEEIQPIPPILEMKEEKRKKEPRACKFCGMRLPKNKAFCLQCGMIIKIK